MSRRSHGKPILIKNAAVTKLETFKPTRKEGITWINPNTGDIFEEPLLTCEYISELSQSNIYARGVLNKLIWLVFTGEPEITIRDPAGNVIPAGTPGSPTVYNDIKNMLDAPGVDLWNAMQQAFSDAFWWGSCILNPVWEYVGNRYTLTNLNRLAPESFCHEPGEGEVYNPLLKGITLIKGSPVYYYLDDEGTSKILQNPFTIVAPQSVKLGGNPMVQPLLLTLGYLNQAWKAVSQTINRAGAPSMWLRVTDGDEDTFTYLKEVLRNWGKNTSFPLPENVEILDPHITEPQNTAEAIRMLQNLLIDYFSPVSLLQAGENGGIFDNSDSKTSLVMAFIQGMHAWIEDAFEKLLQTYLIANKYEGYSARITLPMPEIDKTEADQKWVSILSTSPVPIVNTNELRRFVPGCDELDEAGLSALRAEMQQATPNQPTPMVTNALTVDAERYEIDGYERLRKAADKTRDQVIAELRDHGFAV